MAGVAAVIVAAGRGSRAGGDLPKQFRPIGGESMLRPRARPCSWNMARSASYSRLSIQKTSISIEAPSVGSRSSSAGVRRSHQAGLGARRPRGARTPQARYRPGPRCGAAVRQRGAGFARDRGAQSEPARRYPRCRSPIPSRPSMPQAWSTRRSTAIRCGWCRRRKASPSRLLLDAHRRAAAEGREDFTDDAALAEWAGMKVSVFAGEPGNIKITEEGDFARAEAMQFAALGDVRIGTGIDVHAFGPGDHVTLGGIKHPARPSAHRPFRRRCRACMR